MGRISQLSRALRSDRARIPAVALSKKLQKFYSSHFVSDWQRKKIQEIRDVYQEKQKGLDAAHDVASSKLSEEFMAFELEYLEVSDRLKEKGDGHEPFHNDVRAVVSPAFYKKIGRGIKSLFNYGQKTA